MATRHPLYLSCAWRRLSRHVRMERAMGRCEHCGVSHGAISANGRSIIFLGCAHLNGDRYDFRPENLRALCPQCHFIYDELSRLILAQRPAGDGRPRPGRRRGSAPRRTVTSDRRRVVVA